MASLVLLGVLCFGTDSLAQLDHIKLITVNATSHGRDGSGEDLYFRQQGAHALETPDLKIAQDSFVYGVATPGVVTAQTLGAVMGGAAASQTENRSEIIEHSVQPGDTIASVAATYGLSINTILWANDLSKNSVLKTGEELVILPVDGALHVVKAGDTIAGIAKTFKVKSEDIIAFNGLSSEGDVFIGDIVTVPGGVLAPKTSIAVSVGAQNVLPDSWGIFPLLKFKVTQGLHRTNAIDISSLGGSGSPVYAVAGGVVQRAGYDRVGGNRVTILHDNGVVTYYGHLGSILVKPGNRVETGQQIGSEGSTGVSTGRHVHFQVIGAANFLAKYGVGTVIDVTKK